MDDDEDPVVIIDNGSGMGKAGLSTDQGPTAVFPEVVGKPKAKYRHECGDRTYFVGNEVLDPSNRGKLSLSYPLENGIIENMGQMEAIWEYIYDDLLKVSANEYPVLLTEPPFNPKPNRERITEIMFETFQVPDLNISIQGVLALLGQGHMTGLVVDSGDGVTHTVPVYDGYAITHAAQRLNLAGRELNVQLAKRLAIRDICLTTSQDQEQVRAMKEKCCYVSLDPANERAEPVTYKFPDGRTVELRDERHLVPEALFNPELVGDESEGLSKLAWKSISQCEIDIRKTLMRNVVLSGGTTMFPFFEKRLQNELKNLCAASAASSVNVVASANRNFAVWQGAKVSASVRYYNMAQWRSAEEYDEYGPAFIHEKLAFRTTAG
jgi:actin-related protein